MSTAAAHNHAPPRRNRQAIAQQRVVRRRHNLAAILEGSLDPRSPLRHRVSAWPRIPAANRAAVAEPLTQIAMLLRDRRVTIPERTLRRVLAFVTQPDSMIYGEYPNQARFGAYSLIDEVRAHTGRLAPPRQLVAAAS
jgi:hypothetical protein